MSDVALNERLAFLEIDEQTRQALRDFRPHVEAHLPHVLSDFYDHISRWPQVSRMFD